MATFTSHSPEETAALGERWGREAQPGWVLGLSGELGVGKTQLVKGLARGLGIPAVVRSPTFALVHEYAGGRMPLLHLDFYRLATPAEIVGAGLEEYLEAPTGITVAEWIERWLKGTPGDMSTVQRLPASFRWVRLEQVSETERRITYEDFGA